METFEYDADDNSRYSDPGPVLPDTFPDDMPDARYAPAMPAPGYSPASAVVPDWTPAVPRPNYPPASAVVPDWTPAVPRPNYPPASAVVPGYSPVIRPDYSPNICPTCGSNLLYWTWRLLGPGTSSLPTTAQVRFFNASSIREPLDIYLNSRLVLSDLDRMESSGFLRITPGSYRLTIYRRGYMTRPIINRTVTFSRNTSYLYTILGTANNAWIQFNTR